MSQIRLLVLATVLLGGTVCSQAGPSQRPDYVKAKAIADEVSRVQAESALWDKKDTALQMKEVKLAFALEAKAKQVFGDDVFGPFGVCVNMTSEHVQLVQALNAMARGANGTGSAVTSLDTASAMKLAFSLGDRYRSCRIAVEALR